MRKIHGVLIGVALLLVSPRALGVVVTFEEPALEVAVRVALDKPVGDITDTEMATILELEVAFTSVPSGALPLTGIEYCTSLETLTCCFKAPGLTDEQIVARLGEISVVTSLRSLTVTGAVAAGGCSLRSYAVLGTAVDVSPLAALTNLEYLMLFVSAADVAPLSALSSLNTLISSAATVEQIADIATMTQVQVLKLPHLLWDAPDQIVPLASMTGLRDLMIEWVRSTLDTESLPAVPQVES
ncbi:MAG TPA: hypothetical protein PKI11_20900, partial [Candidatus Hydrogenedentes bacterium]|nr:hypothetical protein [Candidatus Hydrogenedentota bacterium]